MCVPGYLSKLLQNHTALACDGDRLSLQCPRHSSISVQAAFYGPDSKRCGSRPPDVERADGPACAAPTTLQKVLDECQDRRACQLPVNSRLFGPDPCPGVAKSLLVSFKCKPDEFKTKTACEDQEVKLHCHETKVLNIYSAAFGRTAHETDVCPSAAGREPQFDCLSYSALEVLSQRCYGKQRCKIMVSDHQFGSPCLPGVKKYLTVGYACVPKHILSAIDPMVSLLNPTWKQKDGDYGTKLGPGGSRGLKTEGVIVSSSLAVFAYVRAHPERAALLFVSSVCLGLVVTLGAVVARGSCPKDCRELRPAQEPLMLESGGAREGSGDEDDDSSGSDFPDEWPDFHRSPPPPRGAPEAADLAERLEWRDQIIQEIWLSSGLDASPPRNLGQDY
ncbi:protein eva-1 homolog C [Ornithorhynchus anatinus]|uniref:protein eva-1 homolog C n=1 Tax=Ornithorhynchus anatinus TaxID=9258 RepID=UPI000155BDB0|nr:protein eva-1 homolog C [Ornithorhynchus anatinus]